MKTGITLSAGIFLASLSAFAQPASTEQNWTPTVEFEKVEHNFGSIPEGPKATYDFNFTNTGKETIKVITAQAGCGCTTPEWPRYDIEPGKTAKISVGYNSAGRPGPFTKDVNFIALGNCCNSGSAAGLFQPFGYTTSSFSFKTYTIGTTTQANFTDINIVIY
jgi:hypothetical protein